jgi:hypothetical protein
VDNGWSHTDQNCCITGGWAPLTVFKGDGYLVREEGQVNFSSACGKGRAFSLSTRKFNVTLFLLSLCSDLRFVDTTVNQTTLDDQTPVAYAELFWKWCGRSSRLSSSCFRLSSLVTSHKARARARPAREAKGLALLLPMLSVVVAQFWEVYLMNYFKGIFG